MLTVIIISLYIQTLNHYVVEHQTLKQFYVNYVPIETNPQNNRSTAEDTL